MKNVEALTAEQALYVRLDEIDNMIEEIKHHIALRNHRRFGSVKSVTWGDVGDASSILSELEHVFNIVSEKK